MGVTGALSLAGAAMSAAGSISQGMAQKATAEANAQIYEAQARNIAEAKKITAGQYRTKVNVLRGQATATAARNGLRISGTTANSISQSIMQLQMDNSYEQYNLELKRQNAFRNAELERYQGKQAFTSSLMKAGSTALNAGVDYYGKYWKNTGTAKTSWNFGKTKLSGGLPTTNKQIIQGSGTAIV